METNTNRKILIGVVTMFLVAISIVGVTYAYFTAQFTPNMNPESVKVTAGNLIANYKNSQSIEVSNVVPGWVSDGLHYYDIDEAATHGGNIYAIKTSYEYTQREDTKATANMGLAMPLQFSVENISEANADVNYIISLNVKQNGMYDGWTSISEANAAQDSDQAARKNNLNADRNRVYATLYKGTFDVENYGVETNYGRQENGENVNKVIGGPYVLNDTGKNQIMVSEPETLALNETSNYFIIFKFANDSSANQVSQSIRLDVEANVIGIQKDNNASVTYSSLIDAETPKIVAENMIVREEGSTAEAEALEAQAKSKKLADFKAEHGSKTVWYDSDNNLVLFALSSEDYIDENGFDTDEEKVY